MARKSTSTADRRRSPRRKPRGKLRVTCHTDATGPNIAGALLDVSSRGVRLTLKTLITPGAVVALALQRLNRGGPVHRLGTIRWVVEKEGGGCVAGAELTKRLAREDLQRLTEGK